MAQSTYSATGIVLRKTKLGESDLIVTLLAEDGTPRKGVAKGARKPSSQFAARLELYNKVDLLCASGRSLDIIKEARLAFSGQTLHTDMDKSMAAACSAELACRFMQPSLENPRLYKMTEKFLQILDGLETSRICVLVGAYFLKCFSICGIRPSLVECVACGNRLDEGTACAGGISSAGDTQAFSYEDGGYLCAGCARAFETVRIPSAALLWSNALLHSAFDAVSMMDMPPAVAFEILQLCQQWCRVHGGFMVKSLRMFMSLYSAT